MSNLKHDIACNATINKVISSISRYHTGKTFLKTHVMKDTSYLGLIRTLENKGFTFVAEHRSELTGNMYDISVLVMGNQRVTVFVDGNDLGVHIEVNQDIPIENYYMHIKRPYIIQ